mgnify:CR=1 FL=1
MDGRFRYTYSEATRVPNLFELFSPEQGARFRPDDPCDKNNIVWFENINNGVFRGLKNRNKWREKWTKYMMTEIEPFKPKNSDFINLPDKFELKQKILSSKIVPNVQAGGTKNALKYFNSFLVDRHKKYQQSISKPHNSRFHSGRISPYLAWGNLSIRYVWQIAKKLKQGNKAVSYTHLTLPTKRIV